MPRLALVLALLAPAVRAADQPGLDVRLYSVASPRAVPLIAPGELPNLHKHLPVLDLLDTRGDFGGLDDNFVTVATGRLRIPADGSYTLRLTSDDGSLCFLGGRLVIDNDGLHAPTGKDAELLLYQGEYPLEVIHFELGGGAMVKLEWKRPGSTWFEVVTADCLTAPALDNPLTAPGVKRAVARPVRQPGDGAPVAGVHPGCDLATLQPGGIEPKVAALQLAGGVLLVQPSDPAGGSWAVAGPLGDPAQAHVAHDERPLAQAPQPIWVVGRGELAGLLEYRSARGRLFPVAWLPRDAAERPTAAAAAPAGPFKGQVFVGDVVGGGIRRVFAEKVGDGWNGAVFHFTQGLQAGVSALLSAPDGTLFVGEDGGRPDWGELGKLAYGLQRLKPNGKPVFELLAVRVLSNGLELEFTAPLGDGVGWDPFLYRAASYVYDPAAEPRRRDERRLAVRAASVSADRRKVFLALPELTAGRVVHLRLSPLVRGEGGAALWARECWVTANVLGAAAGRVLDAPAGVLANALSPAEAAEGWKLLFDGKSADAWRGFRQTGVPAGWTVEDGCLHVQHGGDLASREEYGSFELKVDWNCSPGANSGVIFWSTEEVDPSWESGPEVQVLDDFGAGSALDSPHSAGAMYELYAPENKVLHPAGEWNSLHLIVRSGNVAHWLNGVRVCAYRIGSDDWTERVSRSKFRDMPRFGRERKGHLVLQDHGDEVWFRNLKVRVLPEE
ncbi:MAG: DUF1080 domain-containing protein [Armatimonadetes bacterium]|nr:DUF1080 domain-containing protein [Armatimonadota bacterium]